MARKHQPDGVILAADLPGDGAHQILRRLRCNVDTTSMPVVVAVGADPVARDAFLAAGAQECIPPDCTAQEAHAALQRHAPQDLDFTELLAEVRNEPGRMAALLETGLLDSPPEESFDRLTRVASGLLGVGAALVSLVDSDRQFFKSQIGLAQPWSGQRQSRLSHSFCQWVVSGKEELVVRNAREHPVLRDNLAVRDMGVIAYAGTPLTARAGQVIGSFCAIDSKPHAWVVLPEAHQGVLESYGAPAILVRPDRYVHATLADVAALRAALDALPLSLNRDAVHLSRCGLVSGAPSAAQRGSCAGPGLAASLFHRALGRLRLRVGIRPQTAPLGGGGARLGGYGAAAGR